MVLNKWILVAMVQFASLPKKFHHHFTSLLNIDQYYQLLQCNLIKNGLNIHSNQPSNTDLEQSFPSSNHRADHEELQLNFNLFRARMREFRVYWFLINFLTALHFILFFGPPVREEVKMLFFDPITLHKFNENFRLVLTVIGLPIQYTMSRLYPSKPQAYYTSLMVNRALLDQIKDGAEQWHILKSTLMNVRGWTKVNWYRVIFSDSLKLIFPIGTHLFMVIIGK